MDIHIRYQQLSVNGMSITALKETNGTSVSVSTNTDVDAYQMIKQKISSKNTMNL